MSFATELFAAEEAAIEGWLDSARLAYIKTMRAEEARRQGITPPDSNIPDGTQLFVVYDSDGKVLGYTDAWASAYGAARKVDLTLLSVH